MKCYTAELSRIDNVQDLLSIFPHHHHCGAIKSFCMTNVKIKTKCNFKNL
jgi:hypothetical protein